MVILFVLVFMVYHIVALWLGWTVTLHHHLMDIPSTLALGFHHMVTAALTLANQARAWGTITVGGVMGEDLTLWRDEELGIPELSIITHWQMPHSILL